MLLKRKCTLRLSTKYSFIVEYDKYGVEIRFWGEWEKGLIVISRTDSEYIKF